MPRVSNAVKMQYKPLNSEVFGKCYYCLRNEAVLDDLSPSPKADPSQLAIFQEEWTVTKVCRSCWGRIYTVNLVNGADGFGGIRGLMTVQQKRALLTGSGIRSKAESGSLVIGFDDKIIVPSGVVKDDADNFFVDGVRFFRDEIMALQGCFALKLINLPHLIPAQLQAQIALDVLEISRIHDYCQIIGIEVPEDNDDTDDTVPASYDQWLAAQAGQPDVVEDREQ